ncbi:CHASE3 domain-containing protein [Sorangium sp. So ce1128]
MKTRTWTIGRQITAGFALPLVVMVLLGLSLFQNTQALLDNNQWVKHTHQVLQRFQLVLVQLQDAETGQRGFVITGEPAFLSPYESGRRGVDAELNEVAKLTADNPAQQARIQKLRDLVQEKTSELSETIEMRRRLGFEPTQKVVAEGRGKRVMDAIRALVGEASEHERELLAQRDAAYAKSERSLYISLVGGTGLTILVVLAFGFVIIRGINRRIETACVQVQGSATELQTAAAQQSQGSREQATATSEVSTTMKELLSTSHQIAESTQRVTQIAAETDAAARLGENTVQQAREAIDTVQRQVEQIVAHMLDFGKKSQEIGGILQIINELAEQTNILAINATIEAAGAGDAGRRFSVVADEIRKLADRVGGSTKEIRSLIEELRAAANTTVVATESGSKAVGASTRQFTEVAVGFKRIVDLVSSTAGATREIELSTKQQATAVEQVNVALLDVNKTARETETSSAMTLTTSSELAKLSRELLLLVQRSQIQGHARSQHE